MGDDPKALERAAKAAKRDAHEWARELRTQRIHGSLGSLAAVLADLCRLVTAEVIAAHPDLTPYEGMTAVWCRMGSTRGGQPLGPKTLAAKAGRAPSSVSRQLRKLEALGTLAVVERRGRALPSVLILCRDGVPLGGRAAPPTCRPATAPPEAESVRGLHVGPSPKTSEGVTCTTLTGGSVRVTCRTLTGGSVSSTYGTNPPGAKSGGVARAQARAPADPRAREANTTTTKGGELGAAAEADLADLFTERWSDAFKAHRQNQAPTTRAGMGECIGWLVPEAERLGVSFAELLEAKLAGYWSEDWPKRHRSNPTPLNFLAQLPRLPGPASGDVDRLRAALKALEQRENAIRRDEALGYEGRMQAIAALDEERAAVRAQLAEVKARSAA